ncbi:hypothetical protein ILYODFUR_037605 [Ilyodon furcidens]|uniref:Pyrin domain-containing protein n=1 Tax=Ilyodon furcidens TaxID=33524 RepID=A0ABV0UCE0_9TELE
MEKLSVELLNTLKSLKQEDFEQFKWFLKQDNILDGQKGIPQDDLERAERWQTVDLMVCKYKGPGAKLVAINILQEIGNNDLVERLKRFSEEPKGKRKSCFNSQKTRSNTCRVVIRQTVNPPSFILILYH